MTKTFAAVLAFNLILLPSAQAWIVDDPKSNVRLIVFEDKGEDKLTIKARNFPNCDLSFSLDENRSQHEADLEQMFPKKTSVVAIIENEKCTKKAANFERTYSIKSLPKYGGGKLKLPIAGYYEPLAGPGPAIPDADGGGATLDLSTSIPVTITHGIQFVFQAQEPKDNDSGEVRSSEAVLTGLGADVTSTKKYIYFRFPLP